MLLRSHFPFEEMRLPSISGHPISTDSVSEGEDVHCEFVKEKYTPEFRQEAARLVLESERPIAYVAEEIGVSATILGRWVKLERERQGSVDGRSDADLRAENAVYAGNLLRPRWIMRSCQKPPPSLWRRDAIGKI